ncbi:aminotransferase class I/II-fold pyridoxal phosphate-dependent enzyme [Terriglobus aquaticus]|uniref:Aminotransferase class I/II-fold pyridoxal phosphate-dependent enzyme n=1 Tax=Terriglobus aquaticus TaxID=940139 RepID=A0ABW9KK09_9BACT|nr:aminotransferase class I/II-fold pyridoxal phosphate-dependent enzyme [Terriglobus aquaticus]
MDFQKFCSSTSFSRRNFLRSAGIASAAMSVPAFAQQAAQPTPAGQAAAAGGYGRRGGDMGEFRPLPPDTVIISSNENPLGPAGSALAAMMPAAKKGGRYDKEYMPATIQTISEQFGLPYGPGKTPFVRLYPGSGGPLDMALMSNISPDKPLVCGDPTYEQGPRAAATMKTKAIMVPLDKTTWKYDVKAMLAAHPSPGAYYIVNPNNPTGTITPREDILWLIQNKPAGSVVIVDEAYFHFSNQESVIDQVAAGKDVIVLRTFSKIYGMAGVRAGFAFGRPDLLAKFETVTASDRQLGSISLIAAAMAHASLTDKDLVPLRRKINRDTLDDTLSFLEKHNYKYIPGSQANMFMVDVNRPGREVQAAMLQEKVAIGRVWPALPTYVRVTVGTPVEMKAFQTAFLKVMNGPSQPTAAHLEMLNHIPHEIYRA